jgi:diphosphomevalonate decarboxylase
VKKGDSSGPNGLWGDIPERLKTLQCRIVSWREEGLLELQNGDLGFASAPSNIALIKYWGKEPGFCQVPVNSSLSLSLDAFRSWTRLQVRGRSLPQGERDSHRPDPSEIAFGDDGTFEPMIPKQEAFVRRLLAGWGDELALLVRTENNFPQACGLASSASGYAALVGAVADLLQLEARFERSDLAYWLVEWARIGSGSACRSALPGTGPAMVAWERPETRTLQPHGDNCRVVRLECDALFLEELRHLVVVFDAEKKDVSSSEGHERAGSSPLQAIRVAGIPNQLDRMKEALRSGDFATVARITETEAFALHAVMQTGEVPARYIKPETARFIAAFVAWRDAGGHRVLWTLDAGPNVHLVFDRLEQPALATFLHSYATLEKSPLRLLRGLRSDALLALGQEEWIRLKRLQAEGLLVGTDLT